MPRKPVSSPSSRLVAAILLTLMMFWAALLLGGCGNSAANSTSNSEDARPRIVATTGMIGDMVSELVGQDARVETIMGPGVDPHLFQPSRSVSVKLRNADVVVYNGLHLEGRLSDVLAARSGGTTRTISLGEMLPEDRLLHADAGVHDPHIWMDVSLWSEAVGHLADELSTIMPEQSDAIRQRADAYQAKLAALDRWGAAAIETIPTSQRILITAHDAFRYFGKRYGVEVHGVQGVSTISDAAIQDVNRLVDLITVRQVPAVFFESSVSPRQVKAIVEGARSRGQSVSSDWELLSDSMGAENSPTGTYVGMMRHNFTTIATALGGSPDMVVQEIKLPRTFQQSAVRQSAFQQSAFQQHAVQQSETPIAPDVTLGRPIRVQPIRFEQNDAPESQQS
ncbi:Periplasmic zinc-binding protein TroA precursor [Rubripirellula lacrimiformis]|uniref:Periplasmic zinc-binding protein TroA n=1 Tax=Rubripirellula lacrimiformis TaxID=1930273 RepID=A0A517NHA1_9BACT|nr:zinc ABC transporter substrate-binding protein [Rubripirellula lacrimiformis]QDT06517.1 Periplasmic zinc-binding protein TroA precursor [Rubripirellula lacrimiformis]